MPFLLRFSRFSLRSLLLIFLPASLLAAQPAPPDAASAAKRPNILWVVSEDNAAYTVGAYGDPLARTPHIDRLAAGGVLYERAYCPAPVCAPTRSSIITGVYTHSLGTQHMRSTQPLPPGVRFFPELLREAGYYCVNRAKTDYNTSVPHAQAWHASSREAHWRNRPAGAPFFAVFNFEASHESRLHTREPLITDPAKVRVPAYLPDNAETRADLAQYYDCVSRADAEIGAVLEQLAADGLADDTIVFYYADNGGAVSRSKRFLYANGTHVPFVVHFPKNFRHLAPAAPGTRLTELVNLVDLPPTVLSLAGLPVPDTMQGRALAGPRRAPAPEHTFMLRDRMDERYDLSRAVTDGRFRYIRHYLPHRPLGQHLGYLWRQASMQKWAELHGAGKLDAIQRRFFEPKPAEELFDDRADPDNVRNLAVDPAHAATLNKLRAAQRDHLLRLRDSGFMPEAMLHALAAGRSPREVTHDTTRYPLERILDLLDALQLAPAPDAALLTASLRDPLPVIRYWAVTSVLARPTPSPSALTPLLQDPDASVRVAAAEAVLRRANDESAWRILADALNPREPAPLRIAAGNALSYLPAPPASVRAAIESSATDNNEYASRLREFLLARDAP